MRTGWFNGEREYYATAAQGSVDFATASLPVTSANDGLTDLERELCQQVGIDTQIYLQTKAARGQK